MGNSMKVMAGRPELGELEPGQKVMVRRSANYSRGKSLADRCIPAVIVKAARVWVDIVQDRAEGEVLPSWSIYRWRMRRDTQNEGSQYSGSNTSFLTLDQYAWELARARAFDVLGEHGIRLDRDSCWSGREVALADLLSKETTA